MTRIILERSCSGISIPGFLSHFNYMVYLYVQIYQQHHRLNLESKRTQKKNIAEKMPAHLCQKPLPMYINLKMVNGSNKEMFVLMFLIIPSNVKSSFYHELK